LFIATLLKRKVYAAYTFGKIAEIIGALAFHGSPHLLIEQHCFDTRQYITKENTLFWALKSNFRDGHLFIEAAYQKGIRSFCIAENAAIPFSIQDQVNWALVPDVLAALQRLALYHRRRFQIPVVGITGSNGKTIVKEWLADIMASYQDTVKSPMSYNSQLGVPLSILQLQPHHRLGIFEAGISQMGEMEKLESLIAPTVGILTHFGDAHQEGFPSPEVKLKEKLKLFQEAQVLICSQDNPLIAENVSHYNVLSVGFDPRNTIQIRDCDYSDNAWRFTLCLPEGQKLPFVFPLPGLASLENIVLVLAAANYLGAPWAELARRILSLKPVSMRTELITDNPEVTILNDSYNADLASIYNAFGLLEQYRGRKIVILSDLEHLGEDRAFAAQAALAEQALQRFGADNLFLIGPRFFQLSAQTGSAQTGSAQTGRCRTYPSLELFLDSFNYDIFRNTTVLLKGARRFELEKIIPYLSRKAAATYFKINLNKLAANYYFFRKLVPPQVDIMVMLKASAYGAGSWQIALELDRLGAAYFAVAFTAEGIELRERGIKQPILVLNPEEKTLPLLIHYSLTPAVGSIRALEKMSRLAAKEAPLSLHLEFDTGMARLGFAESELPQVVSLLQQNPSLLAEAVFTHLASSDEEEHDSFTFTQLQIFERIRAQLQTFFPRIRAHCLNTAGILRLKRSSYDWVRLGIGLYGISPTPEGASSLQEIGSMHSVISQLHYYAKGASIGYNRSQLTEKESVIATVPVGYADGIPRCLSNGKVSFKVRRQWAPTIGKICMDMLMLDVTGIEGVSEGDEVVIFGGDALSIKEFACKAQKIPYEVLTGISGRVRRIYVRE
jgi:alanine racemase